MRTNTTIAVVDYGMGNLLSVAKALESIGCSVSVTADPTVIESSSGLVLPGVGSFKDCMDNLGKQQLIEPIKRFITSRRPFLGICLGMQVLFSESEEFGHMKGLGVIPGRVVHFSAEAGVKIPHMGWNSIRIVSDNPILRGISDGSYFYFVHSYYVVPDSPAVVASYTSHGTEFVSSIYTGSIFACQFHPEKSQKLGLQLLQNFYEYTRDASQKNNPLP
jgi:glutamine amidotransferase